MSDTRPDAPRRSLFSLIGSLPGLISELIKAEIEQAKAELSIKLKQLGVGAGFLAVAAAFGFFALGVLVAAAILGLAVVLPGWAAALIVAGLLLIIMAILGLVGVRKLKQGSPPTPTETMQSVRRDVDAIKGE